MVRALAFLLGASLVALLSHGYAYSRLAHQTALPPPWRRRAAALLCALGTLFPLGMAQLLGLHDTPRAVSTPVLCVAFTWVGVLFFVLLFQLAAEPLRLALGRGDPTRRRFLARVFGLGSAVGAFALSATALANALRGAAIRRIPLVLAKLPPALEGYRIVQLSDLHVGPALGQEFLRTLVSQVNALAPDLIVCTGDLMDGPVAQLAEVLAPLRSLRARHGVYAITGNHEYLSGAEEWLAFFPQLGLRVLRNERVSIGGEDGFDLLGVDDEAGPDWLPDHGPDLPRAARDRDPRRLAILLAHRPDAVARTLAQGIDVQLSGHTHGGQIAPLGLLEKLHQPFVYGHYHLGTTQLYVTSGAGFWGPPMRLGAPAELPVFELRRQA